ncbi:probable chromo domain-containing protein LHP1 isoform X2 [Spinacia oleracea]|uniref:Probable chromo domain-containing protein LHP1 isoform X2 n=1 Tax=Spinacia oleracea TaxID=3562 RepID=A0A9R0IL49_SPIOL|nr:probable chromo domain-containing protein LHP1 isoform X2 [Spinacia oleracea]
MKKTKNSGGSGTTQSESNSLTHSHSLSESHPSLNDGFKELIPSPALDTQRVKSEEEEGEGEREIGYDDEEKEEDGDDDDDDDGEEDDEDDDDEDDEEAEAGEEAEERDGNGADVLIEGKTSAERKKLAEGFYEVESIRRKRICKGEPQYFIKWRGWPESANTWEPVDHLQTCPDVVEAYEERLRSGHKKNSRKRKRKFTQPKKKMQYSYGASKKHCEEIKRPRVAKSVGYKGTETVSPHVASNGKENSTQLFGQNSSGKNMDEHFLQSMAVEGDGLEHHQSNVNSVEIGQGNQRRGAKRRKSGSVRRFTQDMTSLNFDYLANTAPGNISSCDRVGEPTLGNSDAYRKKTFESSRNSAVITRLVKPISYSASVTNNVQDVLVTFAAMGSDGKELTVDNKFLKANYPHLLINFYEQHLRYSPS